MSPAFFRSYTRPDQLPGCPHHWQGSGLRAYVLHGRIDNELSLIEIPLVASPCYKRVTCFQVDADARPDTCWSLAAYSSVQQLSELSYIPQRNKKVSCLLCKISIEQGQKNSSTMCGALQQYCTDYTMSKC